MKKILFICSGNTCRSPMAEALLNYELEKDNIKDYEAESAGIHCFNEMPASENSIKVIQELDIDITDHKSKKINTIILNEAYKIIALTQSIAEQLKRYYPEFREKITTLKFYLENRDDDVRDPFMSDVNEYRCCREEIYKCVKKLVELIKAQKL